MNDEEVKIRKISEIAQLKFFEDTEAFIDPYRINENESTLMKRAKYKIIKYFDIFFEYVEIANLYGVEQIGKNLHEINATRIGYTGSGKNPKGKGFCKENLVYIYRMALKIKNKIQDMPDILILSENVGPDKVSDLVTNIIYEELLEFTINTIGKYELNLDYVEMPKFIFDVDLKIWVKKVLTIPFWNGQEILFIPKNIIAPYEIFSYGNVYDELVYPYYKTNWAIHNLVRTLKDGAIKTDCKKMRKKYPRNRETVNDFKEKYPREFEIFKEEMITEYWRHKKNDLQD